MSSCANHRNTLKNCQSTPKAVGRGWSGGSSEPDILSEVNALKTLEGGRVRGGDGQVGFKSLDFLLGSLKSTRAPGTEELVCRIFGSVSSKCFFQIPYFISDSRQGYLGLIYPFW